MALLWRWLVCRRPCRIQSPLALNSFLPRLALEGPDKVKYESHGSPPNQEERRSQGAARSRRCRHV